MTTERDEDIETKESGGLTDINQLRPSGCYMHA
jgi:hypothetical protein